MQLSRFLPVLLVFTLSSGFAAISGQKKLTPAQRIELEHLQAAHEARMRFAAERQTLPELGVYEDFRAVMHVHAEDADHTKGTRAEVLEAAKIAGVRIVMWTDHRGPSPDTWRGLRDGVLFIAGSEDGNGVLRFPEYDVEGTLKTDGGIRFLSHVEERYDAATDEFVGMEISNRHTDAVLDNSLYVQLTAAIQNPESWNNLVRNFEKYPDEFFAAGTDYREKIFDKWDEESQIRPFTGIGANDAHQNQIFQRTTFDPYEVSFRNLCTHILARELTEPAVRESLREGHVYVSHDWLCDATGFRFGAGNNLGIFTMGDPVPLVGTTRIFSVTPLEARLRLFHNGAVIEEVVGTNLTYQAKAPGAYRLEAWLDVDGESRPWIYANPVYLNTPSPDAMRLPSREIASSVEVRRDISYVEGPSADADKHELDLYIPKGKPDVPVFFFIHGGAWRYGDRSQYPAVGNRFAKEGILTVVPSYRLAPKHPHPAQIEDVTRAFVWVAQNIEGFGGDTNRIFVGGHSAGGHLAALLTLDEQYLKKFEMSPNLIRGAASLSGVFNLTTTEGQSSVFGSDPHVRKQASPLFHLRSGAPPFLVTYCQWDYLTLPTQAREFHSALVTSGVSAKMVFIPRENHISEMVNVPSEDDLTAHAILEFIRSQTLN